MIDETRCPKALLPPRKPGFRKRKICTKSIIGHKLLALEDEEDGSLEVGGVSRLRRDSSQRV